MLVFFTLNYKKIIDKVGKESIINIEHMGKTRRSNG
jgi:hypothetical protein